MTESSITINGTTKSPGSDQGESVVELTAFRKAIGVAQPGKITPRTWREVIWPPSSYPEGLLKDAITDRCKTQYKYYATTLLYNLCIILQLVLGAVLTALGTSANKSQNGIAITILAAANTVNAGIIAILHNTGLPNRIRNDRDQFEKVERYIKEKMQSEDIEPQMSKQEAIDAVQTCYEMYATAKATVLNNETASYDVPIPSGSTSNSASATVITTAAPTLRSTTSPGITLRAATPPGATS